MASVEGASNAASASLAKLVRAEMIRRRELRPRLLDPPPAAPLPLKAAQVVGAARGSDVDLAVSGTVLEATTTRSSHRGGTARIIGSYVGGSISRSKAEVRLHVELLSPESGEVIDSFEVDASNTDTGVGADLSTALGSFDMGDAGWLKTPMGKALRDAAEKLTAEVTRRSGKASTVKSR